MENNPVNYGFQLKDGLKEAEYDPFPKLKKLLIDQKFFFSLSEEKNKAVITDIVSKVDFEYQTLMILLSKSDLLDGNESFLYNNISIAEINRL